jgi:5-methylcytosine-specific restriction endonuclease McrA
MRHQAATADHLTAQRHGGRTSGKNIKAACEPCNVTKGSRTEKRFQQLIRQPGENAPWSLLMAHMRFRIWSREEKAEQRILAVVGESP